MHTDEFFVYEVDIVKLIESDFAHYIPFKHAITLA
jgi:hypothetical protein